MNEGLINEEHYGRMIYNQENIDQSFIIKNLKPNTAYKITMFGANLLGLYSEFKEFSIVT